MDEAKPSFKIKLNKHLPVHSNNRNTSKKSDVYGVILVCLLLTLKIF